MKDVMSMLKKIPELKDVPESQLQWLIDRGECQEYEEGEHIFKPGLPIQMMLVILDGEFVIKVTQNNQHRIVGKIEPYSISGYLPYSRAKEAKGYGEATRHSHVLAVNRDHMKDMIRECHELTTALVHIMSTRIRDFTKAEQQNDKIMALGKLSAGLAHELNNPSAAVIRGSQALKKHLGFLPDKFKAVMNIRMTDEQVDAANEIIFAKVQEERQHLSMMDRSEMVDDLMDWLDDHNVDDSDEVAENFVDFNVTPDDLEKIAEEVDENDLPPVIDWMSQVLTTEKLVNDLEEASTRINDLVSSIKSYTHMDQAPEKAPVDIHIGIDNTLTMLNHKIKKGSVDVVRKYETDLPEPEILASEMNQVWTNIIDNAIDAMEESDSRQLTIETIKDREFVNVMISDTGSGIPEEVRDKIFDPFFTTKAIGKGTGLGLEVVQQIVTIQHHGAIYIDSEPGHTTFKICIPVKAA